MLAARILSPHLTRKQKSPGAAGRSAQGMVHLVLGAGLAMSLFFTTATLLELMKGLADPALCLMPFAGVLPVVFVVGVVRLGRWLPSGDEDWILTAIRSALLKSTRTRDARSRRL